MAGLTKEHKKVCSKCKHGMAAHKGGICHMKHCKACGR
jgi:hypothetical protein